MFAFPNAAAPAARWLDDTFWARERVCKVKAERPVSVQSGDLGGDAGQRANTPIPCFAPSARWRSFGSTVVPRGVPLHWLARRELGSVNRNARGDSSDRQGLGDFFESTAFGIYAEAELHDRRRQHQ